MKKQEGILALVFVAALFMFAGSAQATVTLTDGPGAWGGGIFHMTGDFNYDTFCLERDEHFTWGVAYNYTIGTEAIRGGLNTNSGDPLDQRTAYLYTAFLAGTFGILDELTATSLQYAIWELEEEKYSWEAYAFGDAGAINFIALAEAAVNSQTWSGIGGVRVLNLVDDQRQPVQSVLTMVPEPLTLLLLGLGLFGIGVTSRKISK